MKESRGITINTKKKTPYVTLGRTKIFDGDSGIYINKNTGDLVFIYFVGNEHFMDFEGNETTIKLYDFFVKDVEEPRTFVQHERKRISYNENYEWFCSHEDMKKCLDSIVFNFGKPKGVLPENYKVAFNG